MGAAMRLAAVLFMLFIMGCTREDPSVANGRLLLRQFGCGACHEIPGVAAAQGRVGPPLGAVARRVYLGGVLPNSPENMARFIRRPQDVDPRTAMPDLGVTEAHARDMVAYLYTLR